MTKYISPRARFNGKLGNIEVEQLKLDKTDYKIKTIEDRLKKIEEKIRETNPFFDEYFYTSENTNEEDRQYYKYNPNKTDELSEDINICKYIESYATYLLNSENLEKEHLEKYIILTEEEFKKQLQKEMVTDFKNDSNIILDTRPSNDYKNLDLKITNKDLHPELQKNAYGIRIKDLELALILSEYERLRTYLKVEMQKIKDGKESNLNLYQIKYLLSTIIADMHDVKRMILGIRCPAKRLGDEKPYNDFSAIDYSNEEHIKLCLRYCKLTNTPRPENMCSHIGYDLNNAIKKLRKQNKLDRIDLEIIECYNSNYTIREIANEVKKDTKTIQQRLKKVCKRIKDVI